MKLFICWLAKEFGLLVAASIEIEGGPTIGSACAVSDEGTPTKVATSNPAGNVERTN